MEEKKETPIWKRILLKLTSFKNIVCIWSCVMFSWIVITKQTDFKETGYGLLLIIAGCIGVNLLQKKIDAH